MDEERLKIMQMLADGTITTDEADLLLEVIEAAPAAPAAATGETQRNLADLSILPVMMNGVADFQISNLLATIAACRGIWPAGPPSPTSSRCSRGIRGESVCDPAWICWRTSPARASWCAGSTITWCVCGCG